MQSYSVNPLWNILPNEIFFVILQLNNSHSYNEKIQFRRNYRTQGHFLCQARYDGPHLRHQRPYAYVYLHSDCVFLAQTAYREKEIASTSEKQESVNIAYRVLECWRNSYHQQVPSTLLRRRLRNLFAMIVYKAPTLELPNSSKRYVSIICLNICCLAVYV